MEETSPPELYFAYGSNLDLAQMRIRCPGATLISTGWLDGYRLVFGGFSHARGGGTANLVATNQGDRAHGVLFHMTPKDWDRLDPFEGYPRVYDRHVVRITNPVGWVVEAQAYIKHRHDPNPPASAYRRIVETGYRFHGLPMAPLEIALAESQRSGRKAILKKHLRGSGRNYRPPAGP